MSVKHNGPRTQRSGRATLIGVGLALAAVLTMFGRQLLREESPKRAAASNEVDELARMRREMEQMRRESVRLQRRIDLMSQLDPSPSAEVADEHASPSPSEGSPAALPQASVPSREEELVHIETVFTGEPSDSDWNPSSELRFRVTQILPEGSSIRELDCRSSMCRLETSHRDEQSYQLFGQSFSMPGQGTPVWPGAAVFDVSGAVSGNSGEVVAVAYLARSTLPAIAQE